jgi:hypothetical protein
VQTTKVGQFELVVQLGGKKSAGTSTGTDAASNAPAQDTKAIPSLNVPVRLDSWAPIIE